MDKLTLLHCQVPADHYDREIKNNLFLRLWHKNRFNKVGQTINNIYPQQILDIGCHGGTFTEAISRQFPRAKVFGIDICSHLIAYAQKKRPKINFKVASAEKLPFPDRTFQLVTCFDMLEHLSNPGKALDEISRVLSGGGILVLTVPSENLIYKLTWWFWTVFGAGRVWQETHVQNFSHHKIDDILKDTGFQVNKKQLINWSMLILIKAQKVLL